MNKKQATKWIKALRSGKYKQGTGALKKEKDGKCGHCCLGVLAEINGFEDLAALTEVLTFDMQDQCDIGSETGVATGEDGEQVRIQFGKIAFESLAEANDEGVSFKRIATWIEKNYKYL